MSRQGIPVLQGREEIKTGERRTVSLDHHAARQVSVFAAPDAAWLHLRNEFASLSVPTSLECLAALRDAINTVLVQTDEGDAS